MTVTIRDAIAERDAAACADIYRPYVNETTITFEEDAPDAAAMAERIRLAQREHVWLIAEQSDRVVGYAYATKFKERVAYRWSCETSVYLHPDAQGRGLGRRLYEVLLERLREQGFRIALGVITVPNHPSTGLHARLGFEPVALLPRVGWKHGAWRDVAFYQMFLADDSAPVAGPLSRPSGARLCGDELDRSL